MRELMEDFGIEPAKLVWGLAIGCNAKPFDDVSIDQAIEAAKYVQSYGMAGIMTWSLNRDTNHRNEPQGVCNEFQTGYTDGTYLQAIHDTLN